jgi:hypothetical protein
LTSNEWLTNGINEADARSICEMVIMRMRSIWRKSSVLTANEIINSFESPLSDIKQSFVSIHTDRPLAAGDLVPLASTISSQPVSSAVPSTDGTTHFSDGINNNSSGSDQKAEMAAPALVQAQAQAEAEAAVIATAFSKNYHWQALYMSANNKIRNKPNNGKAATKKEEKSVVRTAQWYVASTMLESLYVIDESNN